MLQGRFVVVWLSWLIGGLCGVAILLLFVCYCHKMPRYQKSFDEQYLKETYSMKEPQKYTGPDSFKIKIVEKPPRRQSRPASYAGGGQQTDPPAPPPRPPPRAPGRHERREPPPPPLYASSTMLDEVENARCADALKTRSLPAFLKPKPRPLSSEDDLQQLYEKVIVSKKYKSRMRSEHAAVIALSRAHAMSPAAGSAIGTMDAVLVYDQRTVL